MYTLKGEGLGDTFSEGLGDTFSEGLGDTFSVQGLEFRVLGRALCLPHKIAMERLDAIQPILPITALRLSAITSWLRACDSCLTCNSCAMSSASDMSGRLTETRSCGGPGRSVAHQRTARGL